MLLAANSENAGPRVNVGTLIIRSGCPKLTMGNTTTFMYTKWSKVLLEKLVVAQLIKRFETFLVHFILKKMSVALCDHHPASLSVNPPPPPPSNF
jgi:hypothetical protein